MCKIKTNALASAKGKTKSGINLIGSDHFMLAVLKRGLPLEGISPLLSQLHQTKLEKRIAIVSNGIILVGVRKKDNHAEIITAWRASFVQMAAIESGEKISVNFGKGNFEDMDVLQTA